MKKLISFFLTCVMCFSLVSCAVTDRKNTDAPKNTAYQEETNTISNLTPNAPPLKKLEEEIRSAHAFSDGLAFVETKNKKRYFINREGEIVIDLADFSPADGVFRLAEPDFINGLATIDSIGTVIDKKGKITRPEDVGATYFYDCTLEAGYLLAQVVEANYAGTAQKMGVLDLDFNWIVPPTEDNYNLLFKSDDSLNLDRRTLPYENLCYKDYLYIDDLNKFLNIKNFTLHETWEYDSVPETWITYSKTVYKEITAKADSDPAALDLSALPNISCIYPFSDGRAVVTFANQSADRAYFTLIDSKGNFCFEPVSDNLVCTFGVNIHFDGSIVVIETSHTLRTYDNTGKLLGELKSPDGYFRGMEDGILTVGTTFYDSHLTPLF